MKRLDLIKMINGSDVSSCGTGASTIGTRNPNTGVAQPIPRHREINERLARRIIKMLGSPPNGQEGNEDGEDNGQADEEEAD